MLFQTHKTFVHLRNTNEDISDEVRELSVPAYSCYLTVLTLFLTITSLYLVILSLVINEGRNDWMKMSKDNFKGDFVNI